MHETSRHLYANVRLKIKGSAPGGSTSSHLALVMADMCFRRFHIVILSPSLSYESIELSECCLFPINVLV